MHKTPKKIHEQIARERPFCERQAIFHDHVCQGRSTHEHVWIYAGKQIDEAWAIIDLCEFAHSVGSYQQIGILNKRKNEYISLLHATEQDLKKYPRFDWNQKRQWLGKCYDKLISKFPIPKYLCQNKYLNALMSSPARNLQTSSNTPRK